MQKKVEIYSTPSCHYCHMAKDFFNENGIAYTEYDVASDREKRKEMVNLTSQMGVPVIKIDGDWVVGFNKTAIAKQLGLI
jgi:glutaredoxin-like YruB-family protein